MRIHSTVSAMELKIAGLEHSLAMSKDSQNCVVNCCIVKAELFLVDAVVHTVAKRSLEMMDEMKFSRFFVLFCFGATPTLNTSITSNSFAEKGPKVSLGARCK